MNESFIKIENLSYAYDEEDGQSVPVLKNVSLDIKRGEYLAILGHNGSGKSTLAKLLNMILVPTSGKITVDGVEITSPELSEDEMFALRKKIGMVFQNPDNQLVATIVEEDVAFGPENLGYPQEEIRKRVDDALDIVGMTEYARHEPHRLSGGQKQRIAIAGIIAMSPECIIFDESTSMLDPSGRKDVLRTMEKLNKEKGITIITITHYMNEAAKADRVVVLDDGEVLMDGTPAQIFAHPQKLRKAGLDIPQCSALIEELKLLGVNIDGECYSTDLCADLIFNYLNNSKS